MTAEEKLMGQSPPCRSYRNRAEKAVRTKEKFNSPFQNLIQDIKKKYIYIYHSVCLKGKRIIFYLGNLDSVMESRFGYFIFTSPFKGRRNWDKQQLQDLSLW